MSKKIITSEADTFNTTYIKIVDEAKLIQDQLKQNISFAKKLSKKAQKLYDYGNKKCYIEDKENGIHSINGINDLDYKMELLDQLTSLHIELKTFAEMFNMEVK